MNLQALIYQHLVHNKGKYNYNIDKYPMNIIDRAQLYYFRNVPIQNLFFEESKYELTINQLVKDALQLYDFHAYGEKTCDC